MYKHPTAAARFAFRSLVLFFARRVATGAARRSGSHCRLRAAVSRVGTEGQYSVIMRRQPTHGGARQRINKTVHTQSE